MSAVETGFLSLVIASFGLFAVVLGGTAWYCRDNPHKRGHPTKAGGRGDL